MSKLICRKTSSPLCLVKLVIKGTEDGGSLCWERKRQDRKRKRNKEEKEKRKKEKETKKRRKEKIKKIKTKKGVRKREY